MSFSLRISDSAMAYLRRLDGVARKRFERKLDEICEHPTSPASSKPLRGRPGDRSARVGDWRIIFSVDLEDRVIYVTRIAPRGEVYR